MKFDLTGRIRNTNLPSSKPLLPLLDAVVNSIDAIEDAGILGGMIEIRVQREVTLTSTDLHAPPSEVNGFIISDNGIGFDENNFASFETSDSTWKATRGAKGVGRFLWLKAFDEVRVESVFLDGAHTRRRTFRFAVPSGITDHQLDDLTDSPEHGSVVYLLGFREEYRHRCPLHLDTLADRIIGHCLVYFTRPNCPTMHLKDERDSISLNQRFVDRVHEVGSGKTISVNECELLVRHFHVSEASSDHRIVYCGSQREVLSDRPESPDLLRKLHGDDGQPFTLTSCFSGPVLDRSVNQERTGFNLDDDGAVLPGELTLERLKKAANDEVVDHLNPYLTQVRETKLQEIRAFIETEAPQYRPMLKRPEHLARIPANLPKDKLDLELHKLRADLDVDTKQKVALLLRDATSSKDYNERFATVLEQVNDLGKAALAEHVVHRKLVLDILSKQLEVQVDEHYALEEHIHEIIFPLRSTSDEILFERQNLWIIDEKLTFHRFLASDTELKSQETHAAPDRERPDLVIWNNPLSLSEQESHTPLNSVTIVEFKRPQRKSYREDEDPVTQVYKYIRRIKDGKALSHAGRPLNVRQNTPFYAFVLCDLTSSLKERVEYANLNPTPDGQGYFGYNANLNCYTEILSYDKMVADARRRNRAFFERLQLPL